MAEKVYWVKVRRTYEETKEITAGDEEEAKQRAREDLGEPIEQSPATEIEIISVQEKERLE